MKRIVVLALIGLIGGTSVAAAVDSDRVEGTGKQVKGKIEQGAGDATGNTNLQRQGQTDQSSGKLEDAWGKVKDSAREVGKTIKHAFEGK